MVASGPPLPLRFEQQYSQESNHMTSNVNLNHMYAYMYSIVMENVISIHVFSHPHCIGYIIMIVLCHDYNVVAWNFN